MADPAVIGALASIRQIYSEDVLAQAVAAAAVSRRRELVGVVADVMSERGRLAAGLAAIPGVEVWPSAANFLLVRLPGASRVRARLRRNGKEDES